MCDHTTNTIIKEFKGNNALDILKQLAETAQFAGPVYGGVVYLDAGGDLHFEKIGTWTAPVNITNSDIRKVIAVKREIEGVVNYYKMVIEEESFYPGDKKPVRRDG